MNYLEREPYAFAIVKGFPISTKLTFNAGPHDLCGEAHWIANVPFQHEGGHHAINTHPFCAT